METCCTNIETLRKKIQQGLYVIQRYEALKLLLHFRAEYGDIQVTFRVYNSWEVMCFEAVNQVVTKRLVGTSLY